MAFVKSRRRTALAGAGGAAAAPWYGRQLVLVPAGLVLGLLRLLRRGLLLLRGRGLGLGHGRGLLGLGLGGRGRRLRLGVRVGVMVGRGWAGVRRGVDGLWGGGKRTRDPCERKSGDAVLAASSPRGRRSSGRGMA